MQGVALGWLVHRITGSTLALGLVAFAGQIPVLPLAPLAGVLADRVPPRLVSIVTQLVLGGQAVGLAWLALQESPALPPLFALAILQGVASAFDLPARQTLLPSLVPREDLPSAIALMSASFNVARIGGAALGGLVVVALGEPLCFGINALTYLLSAAVLVAVAPAVVAASGPRDGPVRALREGLAFARTSVHLRAAVPMLLVLSLLGSPFLAMLPATAAALPGGDARTLGWLHAAVGAGAILGTLRVASIVDPRRLPALAALGFAGLGAGLLVLAADASFGGALAGCALCGLGMLLGMASTNTWIQTSTPDAMRGRVMSLYTAAVVGVYPLGALLQGALAARLPAALLHALGAVAVIGGAAWLALRREAIVAAWPDAPRP